MEYLLLIVGFLLLLFSGKYLVRGSVALADHYKISKLVIGVTVVSFGTSAPEMFVSSIASYTNRPEVAIGNVIGSNIANIALVLALTSIIFPIPVRKNSTKIDAPFMLLISLLMYLLMLNLRLGRAEGLIFLLLLVSYIIFVLKKSRKEDVIEDVDLEGSLSKTISIVMILISTAGLTLGSDLLVNNAEKIALRMGISQRVIAISLLAFGTSLPELTTSVVAAFKKEMDISIGNIIGSNIFNILAVLGVASIVKPLAISLEFVRVDIFWMLGISVLLFVFILPFKGGKLTRLKGLVLFLSYLVYLYFLILKK
jgi:cation:H+ antiporter